MRKRKRKKYTDCSAPCAYCKREMAPIFHKNNPLRATRDHVIPKSTGGNYMTWCCYSCNSMKANMPLIEWELFMKEIPEWWNKTHIARKIQSQRMKIEKYIEFYQEYIDPIQP